MPSPFEIEVFDKNFNRLGWIGDPLSVYVVVAHNQGGYAQIIVSGDHFLTNQLMTPGTALVINYRGKQVFSGPISTRYSPETGENRTIELFVRSDFALFDVPIWPVPNNPITNQNAVYDVRAAASAETVLKYYVQSAFTRIGVPVTIAPDLNRGATIGPVKGRFKSIKDQLLPLIDAAGIGAQIIQSGSGLVMDVYAVSSYPFEISPESGAILAWSWTTKAPEFTRTVAGGSGEGVSRILRQNIDTTAEALWGSRFRRETFTDATDADTPSEVTAAAVEETLKQAATSGITLNLAETDNFRYGESIKIGDLVTTSLVPGGTSITDVLREARLGWTVDDGARVVPVVGDRTDDPTRQLMRAVTDNARLIAAQAARK